MENEFENLPCIDSATTTEEVCKNDNCTESNTITENVSDGNSETKTKRKNGGKVLNVILIVLIIILLLRLIFGIFYRGIYVVGDSMQPTITGAVTIDGEIQSGGDYVYINKFAKPDYGDIVVISTDDGDSSKYIIKRVVALDGDVVKLEDGVLYLQKTGEENLSVVEEDYVNPYNNVNGSTTNGEITVEGIYALGDNRDNSKDSRYYGCFSYESIVGVVTDWSLSLKSAISSTYNFFKFDLKLPF